jgi:hypothetical protein
MRRPAPADQIWVRADVRDGRTDELKSQMLRRIMQMLRRIMQDVGKAGGAAEETVWVYLSEIPAENVAEHGRVLASAKYGRSDSLSCGRRVSRRDRSTLSLSRL